MFILVVGWLVYILYRIACKNDLPYIHDGLSKHLAIAATGLVGVGLNLHQPIARAGVILHHPIQLQHPAAADSSYWIGWCRFKPTPASSCVNMWCRFKPAPNMLV